jgi:hypothetical protein
MRAFTGDRIRLEIASAMLQDNGLEFTKPAYKAMLAIPHAYRSFILGYGTAIDRPFVRFRVSLARVKAARPVTDPSRGSGHTYV